MNRPLMAVGALIQQNGKVLLVKRTKPPNAGTWAIPGGKVEYGETVHEALIREINEETSLIVKPSKLLAVVQIIKEGFHYIILDFICDIEGGSLRPASDAKEARFFSLEELEKLEISSTTIEMLKRYIKGEELPIYILDRES